MEIVQGKYNLKIASFLGCKCLFANKIFYHMSVIHFIVIRIMDRMGLSPILFIITTVTLCIMLINNIGKNGFGLKMLPVNRSLLR